MAPTPAAPSRIPDNKGKKLRVVRCELRVKNRGRSGFTLVEAMCASVVLTIAVLGLSGTLAASYQQTIAMHESATAVALGRQLLEEITAYPFTVSGSAPANRPFNSISQYNGYTDTSSGLPTLDGSTVDATGAVSYTRSVTVQSSGS